MAKEKNNIDWGRKMKKIIPIALTAVMSFGILSPVLASANEVKNDKAMKITNLQETSYTYDYQGIKIHSTTPLTQDELKSLYKLVINPNPKPVNKITPQVQDPGGSSSVMVVPPIYKTYTHAVAREAADVLCAYILKKIPKKVTDNVFSNWVLSKLLGWSKNIQPTYVGTWISSAWSNYDKRRNYYTTIVHYSSSDYKTPIDVQYFECNNWYK